MHFVLLDGFDDLRLDDATWKRLADATPGTSVFQTRAWSLAWWRAFGRGRLLLIGAVRDGQLVCLAPLFEDCGEIYFVASGGSDFLNFVGDASSAGTLEGLLRVALHTVRRCVGIKLYHVPDDTPTGPLLGETAEQLGWDIYDMGSMVAPAMNFGPGDPPVPAAAQKESLIRAERRLRKEGELEIEHACEAAEILPHLDAFFDQHIRRWAVTPHPSLFHDEKQRAFYRDLAAGADPTGAVRFTRVVWNGQPVSYHFGFQHRGVFLWYKPSFEIDLARKSPGDVLLRQLILYAAGQGARTFDFGLGDEAFKARFSNRVRTVRTWGLYPRPR